MRTFESSNSHSLGSIFFSQLSSQNFSIVCENRCVKQSWSFNQVGYSTQYFLQRKEKLGLQANKTYEMNNSFFSNHTVIKITRFF